MEIEVTKRVEVKEIIDIEFPYYFKHDLLLDHNDCIIYRKIDENKCVSITTRKEFGGGIDSVEIEVEKCKPSDCGYYFEEYYKSNKEEFDKIYSEVMQWVGFHGRQ